MSAAPLAQRPRRYSEHKVTLREFISGRYRGTVYLGVQVPYLVTRGNTRYDITSELADYVRKNRYWFNANMAEEGRAA
jgi:hypothetical protein